MMTRKEILTSAVEKAVKNGWKPLDFSHPIVVDEWEDGRTIELAVLFENIDNPVSWVRELEGIIYNHDFAKALWGEGQLWYGFPSHPKIQFKIAAWQYHLQQLVVADDPIQYLGENLPA